MDYVSENKEDVVLKYYRKKCRTVFSDQVISIDMNISSLSSPQDILTINDETSEYLVERENRSMEINKKPEFYLFPNPNPGVFQIETNFPLSEVAILKVVNSLGATVYDTQNLTSNTIHLPSSASGQHLVRVILKDGTVLTQKMMIQR